MPPVTDTVELREIWRMYCDSNAQIESKDIGRLMRAAGFNPSGSDLKDLINELEAGSPCKIDFPTYLEVCTLWKKTQPDITKDDITKALMAFTKNHSTAEMKTATLKSALSSAGDPLTTSEISQLLAEIGGKDAVSSAVLATVLLE
eukprot:gb/GEZN01015903.1/.p1 GENE.gb/GEZN01015903.1/~~gb/GEZN01015903.1/.p1  ORF type:complete len:146 (+),score=24.95 gb/GEZN01015903.1/:86-523(+)